MASSDVVSKRKSSSNVFTPILPQEWQLNFSSSDPHPNPNEVGGPIGRVMKSTGAAFQKVDKGMRRKADRNLVTSLRFLLKKIGAIVLTALHDSAMPKKVHNAIDEIFVITWPEVEKGILDGLVLDLGFQFKDYREKSLSHEAQYPEGFFERCRATLLYAMKPYDMSFFGMMRCPTLFAINLIFLFPLLGVDSICVITLWLCTYKYDEFQLAAFIITSKGLGLVTAGLISGAIGFVKLYMCSMVDDPNDPGSCHHKAPGKYLTAEWEFWLYMFRVVLLWVTFFQLNFLHERLTRRRKNLAARARTEATMRARRGLLPPAATVALQLALPLLLFVATLRCLLAGGNSIVATNSATGFLKHQLTLLPREISAAAMARMQAGGTLWSLGLALLCVLLTHDILSTRKHSWMPSAVATLAAAAVSANFGWLLFLHQSEEHGSKDHSFLGMVLLLSLLSLGSSFALMVRQMQEAVVDKADLKKLEQVMAKLDADDDGHVDKVEFKSIYQEVFPGFGGTFEELWARLDRNKDGKLSKEELALALGLHHLTTAGFAEDDSPSEALARELAAKQGEEDDDDDVDEKLIKLQAEKMKLRTHHLRPGGVMFYFFLYDVVTTSLLFGWILYSNWRNGISRGDWRYDTSLYFTKVALGLLSTPYVVFMIPVVTNWLTNTRPTAYDKAGNCVPKLPAEVVNQRFEEEQAAENKERAARFAEGKATYSDKWVKMLGTYDDDQLLEEELQEELGLGSGELAGRRKEMKEAEQRNASAKQVMSADERAMDEMKTEAKRAFAKKQRQQMEARKPEASLMLMRRDEQTGQLRLAGFEAASML